jgi:hypothetical protein
MECIADLSTKLGALDIESSPAQDPRGYKQSDSRLRGDRAADYLRAPVEEDVRSVPGVGKVSARTLKKAGIDNTYQLFAVFMAMRQKGDTSQKHCDKFWNWLEQHGTSAAHRSTVVHAVAEKLNTFMPGFYVPDDEPAPVVKSRPDASS